MSRTLLRTLAACVALAFLPAPTGAQQAADYFTAMDANGSGEIELPELLERSSARASRMDSNEDGFVTKDEFVTFRGAENSSQIKQRGARFERLDTNIDGRIGADERRAAVEARFAQVDKDGSGGISRAEVDRAMGR